MYKKLIVNGLIGKKIGMTSIFNDAGQNVACTVIEAGPCVITQLKDGDSDGYESIQIGYGDVKAKKVSKAMQGHFDKAGTAPKRKLVEFRDFDLDRLVQPEEGEAEAKTVGSLLKVEEVFAEGDKVSVIGTTKGKGFQGVVKRHGFAGVNDQTHGQHNRQRAPGSIGAASYPGESFQRNENGGKNGR